MDLAWGPVQLDDPRAIEQRNQRRQSELHEATIQQLSVYDQQIDLRPLYSALSPTQWQETDVIFLNSGPLMVGPTAWLRFGEDNKVLDECVASVSSVISLTLRAIAERDVQPTPDKMLSVHWDRPEARVYSQGMRQLQQSMLGIGKQYGKPVFYVG